MTVSTFLIGAEDGKLYSMTDGVKRPTNSIDMAEVMRWIEYDPFWANRGKAVQGYADLERSLCFFFSVVGGTTWETSATIFYKITNTNARNAILEKLLHKKCGSTFNLFWNPYIKELRQIDLKRNEIVHWLAAANCMINSDNIVLAGITLIPPASVGNNAPQKEHITSPELFAFAQKCDDFARLISGLSGRIQPPQSAPEIGAPWLDIFRLPLIYPLQEGHPYRRTPEEHEIHPQSCPPSLRFLRLTVDKKGLQPWNP